MVMSAIPVPNVDPVDIPLTNAQIAERLAEVADLLEEKTANPFRVRAYRRAAETIRGQHESVAQIVVSEGPAAMKDWPGIGKSIAGAIEHICRKEPWSLLTLLRGKGHEEAVLATVASVGPKTAERIRQKFGIETLEDLEAAAYDGRLADLPGIGRKRLRAIRESLAGRFQRRRPVHDLLPVGSASPSMEELLSIDEEYRLKADKGRLLQVAPLRFNPKGTRWLSILHAHRDDRKYTAIYSNSPLANQLNTTHDWVVIFRDGSDSSQWTVITERRGPLKGRRVVRGHESDCAAYYARSSEPELFPE